MVNTNGSKQYISTNFNSKVLTDHNRENNNNNECEHFFNLKCGNPSNFAKPEHKHYRQLEYIFIFRMIIIRIDMVLSCKLKLNTYK